MRHQSSKTSIIVSLSCGIAGFYLLAAIFINVLGYTTGSVILDIFAFPGKILLRTFFLAAFYVPLYIFGCGLLLLRKPFNMKYLGLLAFSIVPFFTFSLLLKIVSIDKVEPDAISLYLYQTIGVGLSGLILSTLLVFEFYVVWLIVTKATVKSSVEEKSEGIPAASQRAKKERTSRTPADNEARKLDIMLDTNAGEGISGKRELILSMNRVNRMLAEKSEEELALKSAKKIELKKMPSREKPVAQEKPKESKPAINRSLPISFPAINDGKEKVKIPEFPPIEQPPEISEKPPVEAKALTPIENSRLIKKAIAVHPRDEEESSELIDEIEDEAHDNEIDEHPRVRMPKMKGSGPYSVPVDGILKDYEDGTYWTVDEETRDAGEVLMETLREFNIQAEVTGIRKGPVITMFEILPAPGVKLSKITNLADNIALRLAASRVRIVAPIPGKHAVGIEVPNKKRAIVSFKELITLDLVYSEKYEIPIIIGKDIAGEAQIIDLVQTPHLLIAGATGSGKSVCVNSIICSILYTKSPDEVKLMLIDPKIVELKFYNDIPHLLTPVVTEPKKAFQALQYCLCEMERRYSLLDSLGVRDIGSYNKKAAKKKMTIPFIPYIVILIDEFADLIATTGKDMEATIARLAAMSRAVGIHVVLATQRPSVDVITGLIKANIPSRIAFMVASKFDSRIIIDSVGAEKLLGKGDMLLSPAWDPIPIRIQGAYLAEEEVEAVAGYVKTLGEPDYIDEDIFLDDDEDDENIEFGENDPLMEKALEIVVTKGKASASYLQRRLKIGYNRAARIVEEMELRGIVGPANGSKPRDILHIPDRK